MKKNEAAVLDIETKTEDVYVVYTRPEDTLAAVRVARRLARSLKAPLSLVNFHLIPFPAQMEERDGIAPAENKTFLERLRAEDGDVKVRVVLCREERDGISAAFKPHSLIVIGGHHGWRSSASERWRRLLEKAGHYVVFVDAE